MDLSLKCKVLISFFAWRLSWSCDRGLDKPQSLLWEGGRGCTCFAGGKLRNRLDRVSNGIGILC